MREPSQLHDLLSGRRKGVVAVLMRAFLWVGQWPYYLAVTWRNVRYERRSATIEAVGRPVISVGNLTTGGTGKTPVVEWISRWLRAKGLRVALLSRGYGAQQGRVNDEAMELEQRLPDVPHLQSPDRVEIARTAIDELDAQVLLLDDGFQHRRLARDLDIVLIDAIQPFGFGHLLPRGLLRESLSGLARADLILVSRADAVSSDRLQTIASVVSRHSDAPLVTLSHQPLDLIDADLSRQPRSTLSGRRVAGFCGIGNPDGFRHTLTSCGYEVVDFREFPDHHSYQRTDVDSLTDWLADLQVEAAICTHKDLVKIRLRQLGSTPLWAQSIGMRILDGGEALESCLRELCPDS